ncbi:DUF2189 domain-containing protein [Thiorhodococcus mannitoliphagus]|uniref:DUF2189 domain-containing protein n=1 Tax=Thiorhodococcus mannitoliphagus TaxID=329406 RepID=A0A6P1DXF5_9GAMM|nr:DUF2189 domain-containing protein [Thiorhodococcus mannitoliphagus]NEX22868.1 DUF2189 domain-containing protein [Thiorhodococcus mannitoliphagus]
MGTHVIHDHQSHGSDVPSIRKVDITEPLDWIRGGARTLARHPAHSLLYGSIFALACWLTALLTWSLPWFTVAFLTGLMLMGPFLAAGLYVAARQSEVEASVSIGQSVALIWERRTNLSLFVLFLGLIAAAWVRLSALLFAIKFSAFTPSIQSYQSVLGGTGFDPVVSGFFVGIGFILAATVFVTSAVAIPLILDRDAGPITAIQASVRTFNQNWPAMLLWAAIIVALSGIGILTFFLGMVVIFPLLGYATWESYKRMLA